ncbi:hypothetical protein Poli38472_011740 [Pythium oligandrum]|uniref:Actin-related protein n=1 Tax=Pythium oligandrum TaxID=41045 RepID=A0A8K1C8Z1_PYTOL|nr:hypothetical protein Poli38472_011740 [Pythium oligandrum]|eukprot:TMW58152.1 hypothetical protein Poli38472_011740 [Pythium oligandrum]
MYAGNGGQTSVNVGGSGGGGAPHASGGSSAMAESNDLDALVFEFGTAKCKFGYAGEDFPRVYESPVHLADGEDARACTRRAALMETDYEAMAQWLFDAAGSRLQTKLSEHPLLLVERPFAIPDELTQTSGDDDDAVNKMKKPSDEKTSSKKRDLKARERLVEVLMEQMDLPALFCAKSAVLTCYANARTSGLVVEMGATYTSVTSVYEGYAFAYPKSQMQLFGGHDLDAFLRYKLHAQLNAPPSSPSTADGEAAPSPAKKPRRSPFYWWSRAVDAKESGLCRVADGPFDEAQNTQLPKISYELPDKTIVQLGTERFSVAEQYFTPPESANAEGGDVVQTYDDDAMANELGVKRGVNLPQWICETGAMTTEAELRKELFQNVVLTGGSSSFENLPARLEREIIVAQSAFQSGTPGASTAGFGGGSGLGNVRVKLVAAHAQERRIGSFLGGSILASLGSFHEMWMSKAEYAEHGAALIHKKCP